MSSGDAITHSVPIYQGNCLSNGISRLNIGGKDLTEYLVSLLSQAGYTFTYSIDYDIHKDQKEKLSYIALDYDNELKESQNNNNNNNNINDDLIRYYEMPDGQKMKFGKERFQCPEALFKPSDMNHTLQDGIDTMIVKSINKCNNDIRKELYGNIVLAGASTLFKGIEQRLLKELKTKAPESMKIKIISPLDRKYSAWIGGSILASLPSFEQMWITKDEYDEHGPDIVHRKCK